MSGKTRKRRRVLLTEQMRAAIVLMAERYEGKKGDFQRMDRAIGILDRDFTLSDQVQTTQFGVSIDLPSLRTDEEEFIFDNEPFKTLRNFLKEQPVNYSRRQATIGRLFIDVLEAFEDAEEVEDAPDN
jgi:hypothetical protein